MRIASMATEFLIHAVLQSLTFQYIFDICDYLQDYHQQQIKVKT